MTRATVYNLFGSPAAYHRVKDDHATAKIHHQLARQTWHEMRMGQPGYCDASPEFADGFEAGYVDYLTYGGNGLPPLVPPEPYWRIGRRYSDENTGSREWLGGFELGAQTARESGFRESGLLPATGDVTPLPGVATSTSADQRSVAPQFGAELKTYPRFDTEGPRISAPQPVSSDANLPPVPEIER